MKKCLIALVCMAMAFSFVACKDAPADASSVETEIVEETVVVDETVSSENETTTESSVDGSTPVNPEPQTQVPTTSTPEPEPDYSGVVFVQPADPKTGISWDGVSPIIYTYPDGTTGTEPRDGARYEVAPGMYTTINLEAENYVSDYDGTCPHCGKKAGDGTNGTCLHTLGDMICPGCDKELLTEVCHTCGE